MNTIDHFPNLLYGIKYAYGFSSFMIWLLDNSATIYDKNHKESSRALNSASR